MLRSRRGAKCITAEKERQMKQSQFEKTVGDADHATAPPIENTDCSAIGAESYA